MRFFLYVSVLLLILPLVFMRPFFGLCVYYVVSLLQPKFLCWRGDFQDAILVGVPLVVGAIAIGVRRTQVTPKIDQATGNVRSVIEIWGCIVVAPVWCGHARRYCISPRLTVRFPIT